jgi:hypothetical protein
MTATSFYRSSLRVLTFALIAALGLIKTGCDYSVVEEPEVIPALKISLTPQTAEMQKGTTLDLSAIISGYKNISAVTWEFAGQAAGELKAAGLTASYTAPATITSSPLMVTIRVRSVEDTSRQALAVISVLDTTTPGGGNNGGNGQIAITISPLSATIEPGQTQQFNANVTGSTNTGITWRVVTGRGSVSSTGLYAAPSSVTPTERAVIEAASVADPSKYIRATITIRKPIDPNIVCFERDVKPIFISNCTMSGCHSGPNPAHGNDFTTYEGILAGFDDDNGDENEILKAITDDDPEDRMPLGRAPLSAAQIETIRNWIAQGAKNEDCTDPDNGGGGNTCDTLDLSFANNIQPIFQNTCVGCHSGAYPPKGINLSSHAGIRSAAQTGQLVGAITHTPGFTPMPMNGNKLDDCTIDKIKGWINAGAPNN